MGDDVVSSKDLKPLPFQDDLVIKLKEKRSQPPVSSYIKKKKVLMTSSWVDLWFTLELTVIEGHRSLV